MPRFGVIVVTVAALAASACANSAPPAPSTGSPSSPVTINGTERLGWDQTAASGGELAAIGYALYIDRQEGNHATRVVLFGVSCGSGSGANRYECRAPIPRLSPGSHTLELTSFFQSDPSNESARSNALVVNMTSSTALVVEPPVRGAGDTLRTRGESAAPASAWPQGVVRIVEGIDNPTDLAFTPDGRLWIAERRGRIRVVHDEMLVPEPALTLADSADGSGKMLALAVDPQFPRTRFVYAIHTSRMRSGALAFSVARFREASDTLADRVILLDDVPASADPHASLRFGLDRKLYAAFDDGGNERLVDDAASYNGKVLRLNADGTTPDDAPRKSPIFSSGSASPRGLAWHQRSGRLWIADASRVGDVDWMTPPSSLAAEADTLFVASDAGLVRATIDGRNPARLASTRNIVRDLPIRAVAVSPNGAVYFATTDAIGVVTR